MLSCTIEKCEKYGNYILKDNSGKMHECVLEFYGVEAPRENDALLIHHVLFDKKWAEYAEPYAFKVTKIDPEYVKKAKDKNYILLRTRNKVYALRRIFG